MHGEGKNQNSSLWLIIITLDHKVSLVIIRDVKSFCKKDAKSLALNFFFHFYILPNKKFLQSCGESSHFNQCQYFFIFVCLV